MRLYNLIDKFFYRHNIKHRGYSALFWAAEHNRESIARKLYYIKVDVNIKV